MGRKYTKVEHLTEAIRVRKAKGETNREIAQSLRLSKYQVKQLMAHQNRKERMLTTGYVTTMGDKQLIWTIFYFNKV